MQIFKIIFFILIIGIVKAFVDKKCISCICQQESRCKPLPCKWDDDAVSCGYFQIKLGYFTDCGAPGRKTNENMETAWKRCALDYNCSLKCIKAYMNRYQKLCNNPKMSECEKVSRQHNGGPNGCSIPRTDIYWKAVNQCYTKK